MTILSDGKIAYDLSKEAKSISKNYTFKHEIKRAGGFVITLD